MKRATTLVRFIISITSLLVLGLGSQVQARNECTTASFKGTYGFSCEGTIVGVGPIAVVGLDVADGQGHSAGTETISYTGQIFSGVPFTETSIVNPDCTVIDEVTYSDGSKTHAYSVMVDDKEEIRTIVTDPGSIITCVVKKQ